MITIEEVLEDMQHRIQLDDPTECNLPTAISITTNGKFMLNYSISQKASIYPTLDALVKTYAEEYL